MHFDLTRETQCVYLKSMTSDPSGHASTKIISASGQLPPPKERYWAQTSQRHFVLGKSNRPVEHESNSAEVELTFGND